MMNIWIRWHIGYFAYVDMQRLSLKHGDIYFYNEKGNVVRCDLTDSVQFDMRVNCDFNFRNKVNYTRDEVFAIRHKGGDYSLYIPMSEVGFTKLGLVNRKNDDKGMGHYVYRRYSFNATNLNFWNDNCNYGNFTAKDDKVIFMNYVTFKPSEKAKNVVDLQTQIKETCGVYIEERDLADIVEHFNITKK